MPNVITLMGTTTFDPLVSQPIISDKVKGSGYLGSTFPAHTAQYSLNQGFLGDIKLQASLVTDPEDSDWFDIDGTSMSVTDPDSPSATHIVNFVGLFVWVRSNVTMAAGTLNHIYFTHS